MSATFTNVAMGLRALDPELEVSARSNALLRIHGSRNR